MRVYTEDASYRGETPTRVIQYLRRNREFYTQSFDDFERVFEAIVVELTRVVRGWEAARLALATVPARRVDPRREPVNVGTLLDDVDGDNAVRRTLRDLLSELMTLDEARPR